MSLTALERQSRELTALLGEPASDRLKLVALHRFLETLPVQDRRRRMQSYFLEFFASFVSLLKDEALFDQDPDMLASVYGILEHYRAHYAGAVDESALAQGMRTGAAAMVRALVMVGQDDEVGLWLSRVSEASVALPLGDDAETDPLARMKRYHRALEGSHEKAASVLLHLIQGVETRYRGARSDRVHLALVEHADHGAFVGVSVGCLDALQLKIRMRDRHADTDLCRVVNGTVHPVAALTASLETLIWLVKKQGKAEEDVWSLGRSVDCEFHIPRPELALEGVSWQAPALLLTLAGMVNLGCGFARRRIPQDFILTGAVDSSGRLTPVSERGLREKIRTVFFSPIQRLAVPWKNFRLAVEILEDLRARYPRRQLILESVEDLDQLYKNANMTRLTPWTPSRRAQYTARRIPPAWRTGSLATLVLVALGWMLLHPLLKDRRPATAALLDNRLVVRNLAGGTLWSHAFPFTPQVHTFKEDMNEDVVFKQRSLRLADLDGDGSSEVLLGTCMNNDPEHSGRVFCFAPNGGLLWEYQARGFMTYGTERMGDYYRIMGMYVVRPFGDTTPYLLLQTNIKFLFPSSITLLDAYGRKLGEYWNSGRFHDITCLDINGDGVKEILAGGENNENRGAILVVLDPRHLSGASPQYPSGAYHAKDLGPGSQLAYLRFPHTPLYYGKCSDVVAGIRAFEKRFEVTVANQALYDKQKSPYACGLVDYIFDFDLNLIGMELSDPFMDDYLRKHGVFPPDSVVQGLKQICYWENGDWVER